MSKSDTKNHAANAASQAEAAIGSLADDIKAQVEELADKASTSVGQAYGIARRQVRGAATAVANQVEDRPLVVVLAVGLIAAALGYVFGSSGRR